MGTGSGFRASAVYRGGQRLTFELANVNVLAIRHGETEWSLSGKDLPMLTWWNGTMANTRE
jgi:hypothetical protein